MLNKSQLQFKKLKNKINKIPRALTEYPLLIFLIFLIMALIFSALLFYKYGILPEKKEHEVRVLPFYFKEVIYQKILTEWEIRDIRFKKAKIREYPNLFQSQRELKKITKSEIIKPDLIKPEIVKPEITSKDLINFVFEEELYIGAIHQDVKKLQIFLNIKPETRLTEIGYGSPGKETIFFCWLTFDALVRFQEIYKQEILLPLGIKKGTGFFGRSTRVKVNKILRNKERSTPLY